MAVASLVAEQDCKRELFSLQKSQGADVPARLKTRPGGRHDGRPTGLNSLSNLRAYAWGEGGRTRGSLWVLSLSKGTESERSVLRMKPNMNRKPYWELLRDPRWQKRRLEVLELAEFRCSYCFDTKEELHVHHRIYRKGAMPWEYSFSELACLCHRCHEAESLTRAEIAEALAKLDISELMTILGYAQGMRAEEGKSYELEGASHARGFLAWFHPGVKDEEVKRIAASGWLAVRAKN